MVQDLFLQDFDEAGETFGHTPESEPCSGDSGPLLHGQEDGSRVTPRRRQRPTGSASTISEGHLLPEVRCEARAEASSSDTPSETLQEVPGIAPFDSIQPDLQEQDVLDWQHFGAEESSHQDVLKLDWLG